MYGNNISNIFVTTIGNNETNSESYDSSRLHDLRQFSVIIYDALQENSGILTDIPTENEILGIYRGISEETQNWGSSEKTDEF